MTNYDLAVLALYFVFMLSISWVFRHFVSDVGSYFRSGGQVLCWMAGGGVSRGHLGPRVGQEDGIQCHWLA